MPAVIFVTGHSSGIGAAVVAGTPRAEARIVGVSRRPGTEQRLSSGSRLIPLAADLTTLPGCRVVADALSTEVRFASDEIIFIHAAATLKPVAFAREADAEAYERAVVLNSLAPQILGQAFLRATWQLGPSVRRFLLLLSTGPRSVRPGWSSYKAGKAAIDTWVTQVGEEERLRKGGATVLSVNPGPVDTPMQRVIREAGRAAMPDRERFVGLYERGELRDPVLVATEIWRLIDEPPPTGTVLDLRDL